MAATGFDHIDDLAAAVVDQDRRALAKAITLVESTRPEHRRQAETLLELLLPASGNSVRLGVTGAPGVGKSTFINRFGAELVEAGHRLAVLAVDPSSRSTGGSILGDKTRMADLAGSSKAYVRPSPSGGITGGVAGRTRESIVVCEAAGYDTVIVETVGVGQSETAVAGLTDLFLLLVGPGAGDDLQGIKRGVLELADVVAVNKADGDLAGLATRTAAEYQAALHLVRPKRASMPPAVLTCSALTGHGLGDLEELIWSLHRKLCQSGELEQLRSGQAVDQLHQQVRDLIFQRGSESLSFVTLLADLEREVAAHRISVTTAAQRLAEAAFR